ncbi:MAG: adhesin [Neisseria sp.]|nr:adhesin [Neisseria sp.]
MSEQQQEQSLPSVVRFEQAVKAKDYELACSELLSILNKLDSNFGGIHGIEFSVPAQLEKMLKERDVYFCTRMAVAITELFTDPNLVISETGALRFLTLQRWINLIFASSPYINADHILETYNTNPAPNSAYTELQLKPGKESFIKFCIMYLPESNISVNLDALWSIDPELTASLCIALQSPRFIGTQASFSKRGAILQWFPEKFKQITDMSKIPSGILHDVYMHCSYDVAANKHDVKKGVNHLVRHFLIQAGLQDRDIKQIGYRNGKPVIVVLLEHFHAAHSIYRTHSTSMIAAREWFYLIGVGNDAVDQAGRDVFDEFHTLNSNSIVEKMKVLRGLCEENQAAIFYMPSIGMDLTTIFASNLRFAPIQAVALGHPGTTHSEFIEYVVVEDDYVGSEDCFSETLLRLPKDALPYVPSALAPSSVDYRLRENPEVVHIGIASTTMKLNPYFLDACRAIRDRAKVKVHFHFALGQSMGMTHPYVERFIKSYLGDSATAYPHQSYDAYLTALYQCDMMINPFPFGNTNGIIDMVTLGLVGVCKTGPEVHEHIDEGLFKRLGLPEWLITNTVDEYVACAIRLAENHEERLALRKHIIENNGLQTLFSGDPTPMGKVFLEKLQDWAVANNIVLDGETTKKAPARKPRAKAADAAPAEKKTASKSKTSSKTAEKPAAKTAAKKESAPRKRRTTTES